MANDKKENIQLYLKEIAECLWSGHAAVMVGAGFSKNADPTLPNWNQLGDIFFEKLHGISPDTKDRHLNPIRLATEVCATFGRPCLNQIMIDSIPDTSPPSDLHRKLLNLPWNDLFTLNYDTLLERACDSVVNHRYEIIVNKYDLIHSTKPRIIKLHGSFPSHYPFIITEEDYRTYPREFAPFINTIQQSLLENTLCLIGFSGDDPNFREWIGWLHDQLGSNHANIYLIGILNLPEVEREYLENRNITPIDLACFPNHKDALDYFFDELLTLKPKKELIDWPKRLTVRPTGELHQLVQELKTNRINYETNFGWIIAPDEIRKKVWQSIYWHLASENRTFTATLDIEFAFEMNWCLELCLSSLHPPMDTFFASLLDKYNPSDNRIQGMWLQLALALLKHYRNEGLFDNWRVLHDKLTDKNKQLTNFFSQEQKAQWHYEKILYTIFCLDLPYVDGALEQWATDKNSSLPMWEARRASILAEMGHSELAKQTLQEALITVRRDLNLRSNPANYKLLSQEACLIYLLNVSSMNVSNPQQFDRKNRLEQYYCDPELEMKLFEIQLSRPPIKYETSTETHSFDFNRTNKLMLFHNDNEALLSYSFLTYCENIGLPFQSLPVDLVKNIIPRIIHYSFNLATIMMIRTGNSKVVDATFNRITLYHYNPTEIDKIAQIFLNSWRYAEVSLISKPENRFLKSILKIVPYALSFLCCKCSWEMKSQILNAIKIAYYSKLENNYYDVKFKTLFSRLLLLMSEKEKYRAIPILLDFHYCTRSAHEQDIFINPFSYYIGFSRNVSIDKSIDEVNDCRVNIAKSLNKTIIDQFISELSPQIEQKKRAWIMQTLIVLSQLELLNESQAEQFGIAIWSKIDSYGFPTDHGYFRYIFIKLPHPQSIKPLELLSNYFIKQLQKIKELYLIDIDPTDLALQKKRLLNENNIIYIYDELINSEHITWDNELSNLLLEIVIHFWRKDKSIFLSTKQYSQETEEMKRIKTIPKLFQIMLKANKMTTLITAELKDELNLMLKEMESFNQPVIQVKACDPQFFSTTEKAVFNEIKNAMRSPDLDHVLDGLYALKNSILEFKSKRIKRDLLSLLGTKIYWCHPVGLAASLGVSINLLLHSDSARDDNRFKDYCLGGLESLIDQTVYDPSSDNTDTFGYKLDLRQASVKLAYCLFSHQDNQVEIPEILMRWQEICHDPNEFAEIRNQWID